jgi:hypothetical protein
LHDLEAFDHQWIESALGELAGHQDARHGGTGGRVRSGHEDARGG